MAAQTMTIYDSEGEAYEMEWRVDLEDEGWCQFCETVVMEGWAIFLGAGGLFVVCDACAQANATTEGR